MYFNNNCNVSFKSNQIRYLLDSMRCSLKCPAKQNWLNQSYVLGAGLSVNGRLEESWGKLVEIVFFHNCVRRL